MECFLVNDKVSSSSSSGIHMAAASQYALSVQFCKTCLTFVHTSCELLQEHFQVLWVIIFCTFATNLFKYLTYFIHILKALHSACILDFAEFSTPHR